jgi:hypothetical protein
MVSDKAFKIPVRFSKEAIAEYNRCATILSCLLKDRRLTLRNRSSINAKRLTEYKTAIVTIKKFRPFFARVPLRREKGTSAKGMSEKSYLALDVEQVTLVGSENEAQYEDPRELETNEDIRIWAAGLRQDGGGG